MSIREYREIGAGEWWPNGETWGRICRLYGWPQTFVTEARGRRKVRLDADWAWVVLAPALVIIVIVLLVRRF